MRNRNVDGRGCSHQDVLFETEKVDLVSITLPMLATESDIKQHG